MAHMEEKTDIHGGKSHFKVFLKHVSIGDRLIQSYKETRRWRITKHCKCKVDD